MSFHVSCALYFLFMTWPCDVILPPFPYTRLLQWMYLPLFMHFCFRFLIVSFPFVRIFLSVSRIFCYLLFLSILPLCLPRVNIQAFSSSFLLDSLLQEWSLSWWIREKETSWVEKEKFQETIRRNTIGMQASRTILSFHSRSPLETRELYMGYEREARSFCLTGLKEKQKQEKASLGWKPSSTPCHLLRLIKIHDNSSFFAKNDEQNKRLFPSFQLIPPSCHLLPCLKQERLYEVRCLCVVWLKL